MGAFKGHVHVHVDPSMAELQRTDMIMSFVREAYPVVPHCYWPMGHRDGFRCVDTGPCDACNFPLVEVTIETYEWPDGQEEPNESTYAHDVTRFEIEDDDIESGDDTVVKIIARWLFDNGYWDTGEAGNGEFHNPNGPESRPESSDDGHTVWESRRARVHGVSDDDRHAIGTAVDTLVTAHRNRR